MRLLLEEHSDRGLQCLFKHMCPGLGSTLMYIVHNNMYDF